MVKLELWLYERKIDETRYIGMDEFKRKMSFWEWKYQGIDRCYVIVKHSTKRFKFSNEELFAPKAQKRNVVKKKIEKYIPDEPKKNYVRPKAEFSNTQWMDYYKD